MLAEAGIEIQPVCRIEDKSKIDELLSLAPLDIAQKLADIDWVELERDDIELWDVGIGKINDTLAKANQRNLEEHRASGKVFTAQDLPEIVHKKMEDPTLTLTTDESIECLAACVEFGMAQAEQACNLDCIVLLGNTGAGKSTFANYIHGCQMERVKKLNLPGLKGKDKVIRVKSDSQPSEIMKIGHQNKSMTFVPEVKRTKAFGGNEAALVDCPGFSDNRCVVRCIDGPPPSSHMPP